MDIARLFDLAAKLQVPGLLLQGAEFITAVAENASQAKHVLTAGEWGEIDAIHVRALAVADALDADLRVAEQR